MALPAVVAKVLAAKKKYDTAVAAKRALSASTEASDEGKKKIGFFVLLGALGCGGLIFKMGIIILVVVLTVMLNPLLRVFFGLNRLVPDLGDLGREMRIVSCEVTGRDDCQDIMPTFDFAVERASSRHGSSLRVDYLVATMRYNDMTDDIFDDCEGDEDNCFYIPDEDIEDDVVKQGIWNIIRYGPRRMLADYILGLNNENEFVDALTQAGGWILAGPIYAGLNPDVRTRRQVNQFSRWFVSAEEDYQSALIDNPEADIRDFYDPIIASIVRILYFSNNHSFILNSEVARIVDDIHNRVQLFNEMNPMPEDDPRWGDPRGIYAECEAVTVIRDDGSDNDGEILATLPLEEYVAGVLGPEFGVFIARDNSDEIMKAATIAIRSYTIRRTNGCTNPIRSSTRDQVWREFNESSPNYERIKGYIEATRGQVLGIRDTDTIISTEYFSLTQDNCRPGGRSNNGQATISGNICTMRLEHWGNSGTFHEFSVPMSALPDWNLGAHWRGMPQHGGLYLSQQGQSHQQILTTFYSDNSEIRRLTTVGGGDVGNENHGENNFVEVRDGVFYINNSGNSGVHGTRGSAPGGLNPVFYERLVGLVNLARTRNITIVIPTGTGAWRSFEDQQRIANSPLAAVPGRSRHGWGIAADLGYRNNTGFYNGSARAREICESRTRLNCAGDTGKYSGGSLWACMFAQDHAAQFGLVFRLSNSNSCGSDNEAWHIEPDRVVNRF